MEREQTAAETSSPLAQLRAAAQLTRDGERVAAWQLAQRAAAAAPGDAAVQLLATRLLWVLGDDRGALDASRAALELDRGAAATLRFNQTRDAGWYHEAAAVLERVLAETPPGGASRRGELTFEAALEQLVRLHYDHHHHAAAAAVLDRHLQRAAARPALHLQAARVYHRSGDPAHAAQAIAAALAELSPAETPAAAATLLELGEFDRAEALYRGLLDEPGAAGLAREALARFCLWRDDLDGALAHAACLADGDAVARRIRAAVQLRRGDPAGALAPLDALVRDSPHDGEAHLWRAEANLRLGRRDETCRAADRSLQHGYSYAACAVRMLATVPPAVPAASLRGRWHRWRDRLRARLGARTDGALLHARQELRAELGATCPDADAVLAGESATALADLLERSLATLRGNRTPPGSWARADGSLALVPPSSSPRILSRLALELLRVAPVEESVRALDRLAARFPDSSMPVVHRGELRLWLGDYPTARADLEAAIAIRRQTRWAWYGLAWLDVLEGDPQRGLDTCAHGIAVMDNSEGPVAMIVRGEAYRLLGRLDEAREQLERSNAQHATRVSGWINLALVHGAGGDGAAQRQVVARIARMAPSLLSEAAAQLGAAVFERVILARPWLAAGPPDEALDQVLRQTLVMMRGNRASGLITYFTADGQLRHVPRYLGTPRFADEGGSEDQG